MAEAGMAPQLSICELRAEIAALPGRTALRDDEVHLLVRAMVYGGCTWAQAKALLPADVDTSANLDGVWQATITSMAASNPPVYART